MSTCRFCHKYDSDRALVKYATRHYAHAKCGLERLGLAFFDRLSPSAIKSFPYMAAVHAGPEFEATLVRLTEKGNADDEAWRARRAAKVSA